MFLFEQTVGISTFQLTFLRGVLCSLLVVCMIVAKGHGIKRSLVDPVSSQTAIPLFAHAF